MRRLTRNEKLHFRSYAELRDSSRITVDFADFGELGGELTGNESDVFDILPEWSGVILDPALQECILHISRLGIRWRAEASFCSFGGEFCVAELYGSLLAPPPDVAWTGSSEFERQLYSELRVIDYAPRAGVDEFAAIRVQDGVNPLEIWYYNPDLGAAGERGVDCVKMSVSYCEYLDALRLTKGTFGWQYLYTDVLLRGDLFSDTVMNLQAMLEVFPDIFPDHNYVSLEERLAERL